MDLKHLHTFLALCEFRNFTKTAEHLHYAQSNVTAQIQQLASHQAGCFKRTWYMRSPTVSSSNGIRPPGVGSNPLRNGLQNSVSSLSSQRQMVIAKFTGFYCNRERSSAK